MRNIYAIALLFLLVPGYFVSAQSKCFMREGEEIVVSRGTDVLSSAGCLRREAQYDVKFYFLDLAMARTGSTISGNVLIRAKSLVTKLDTFSVELSTNFVIDSVKSKLNNGAFQKAAVYGRGSTTDLNVNLPFTANLNDEIETRIYYHGNASTSTGSGYYTGPPAFSASPPYNSSSWWPCKQVLTDKADSSWFFITTDTSNTAISNGVLSNKVAVSNTKNRWEWKSRYPIDFYLVCFTIGQYADNKIATEYFHPTGRTDSMPVTYYGTKTGERYGAKVLKKFSDLFGLYPFYEERLAMAAVTLGGGIENQTFISYGSAPNVVEHEIAHQWFGDNVTCSTYKDVWLNEGFARWAESLYEELIAPNPEARRISFCDTLQNGKSVYSSLGAIGYGAYSVHNSNTDTVDFAKLYGGPGRGMNYEKAAMVINSLRFEIDNDSLFFRSLRNYQEQYRGKTANTNDFRDVVENTTGRDMTDFFDQWIYGYGHPLFDVKWKQQDKRLMLEVKQRTSSAKTKLFKTSLELKARRWAFTGSAWVAADTVVRFFISADSSAYNLPVGDSVSNIVVDPNQWILDGQGVIKKDTSLNIPVVEIPTGLPVANGMMQFKVYPNPANNMLQIESNLHSNQPLDVELYNAVGQLIQNRRLEVAEPLDISQAPTGMYILRINNTYTHRVLILR